MQDMGLHTMVYTGGHKLCVQKFQGHELETKVKVEQLELQVDRYNKNFINQLSSQLFTTRL